MTDNQQPHKMIDTSQSSKMLNPNKGQTYGYKPQPKPQKPIGDQQSGSDQATPQNESENK